MHLFCYLSCPFFCLFYSLRLIIFPINVAGSVPEPLFGELSCPGATFKDLIESVERIRHVAHSQHSMLSLCCVPPNFEEDQECRFLKDPLSL